MGISLLGIHLALSPSLSLPLDLTNCVHRPLHDLIKTNAALNSLIGVIFALTLLEVVKLRREREREREGGGTECVVTYHGT